MTVTGYNSMIPLYWTPVYKSNGFSSEPPPSLSISRDSVFAEVIAGPRALRLLVLTAGLCSYSGTGLTMLALFIPFILRWSCRLSLAAFQFAGC
jgi:hypothetical protein